MNFQSDCTPSVFARPSDLAVSMQDLLWRRIAIKVGEPEVLTFDGQLRPAILARIVVLENERCEPELTDLGLVDVRSQSILIELGRQPGQWILGMVVNSDRGLSVADCSCDALHEVLRELEELIEGGGF